MKKVISLAVTALGLTIVMANPSVALAQEVVNLDASSSEGITWVDATFAAGDHDDVSIKIFNVTKRSKSLWQRCNFNFTGTGTYRCGLDSEAGSLADQKGGRWVAKAFVDGRMVARHGFSL